jgi:ATP-binding cassette subfamily B protein
MLIWPMLGAGFTVNMIQRGVVSLTRYNEVMNSEPSIQSREGAYNPRIIILDAKALAKAVKRPVSEQPIPLIEFRGLSFAYNETANNETAKRALSDISFTVEKGTWLGIMGRTGSGKSTLIKTLPRMISPPAGTVFVDGVDVVDWDLRELRKMFGLSAQDSYLFSDSIKSNVRYGGNIRDEYHIYDRSSEVAVNKAIRLAALEKDLQAFAKGADTMIGERGLTLSGGQKQRAAIARALFSGSEILILDDSLSACDAETERRILDNLEKERAGKTTIIVSHRVSTLRLANKIAVLSGGALTEYGSAADLMAAGGFYAKMAILQQAGGSGAAPTGEHNG